MCKSVCVCVLLFFEKTLDINLKSACEIRVETIISSPTRMFDQTIYWHLFDLLLDKRKKKLKRIQRIFVRLRQFFMYEFREMVMTPIQTYMYSKQDFRHLKRRMVAAKGQQHATRPSTHIRLIKACAFVLRVISILEWETE